MNCIHLFTIIHPNIIYCEKCGMMTTPLDLAGTVTSLMQENEALEQRKSADHATIIALKDDLLRLRGALEAIAKWTPDYQHKPEQIARYTLDGFTIVEDIG